MPKITVTYFDLKAIGEPVRLILTYAGQEFTDRRISYDEWPNVKPTTPFGAMPVMEIDGKEYATSLSICRYLAKKYGLIGDNDEEAFEIDQHIDFLTDLRIKATLVNWDDDEEIKEKKHAEYAPQYPAALDKLHAIIEKNNGHIAAGKLTWGDFYFAGVYDCLKLILRMPDMDTKYPAFKKLTDYVYSLPKVKEYAESAPKTEF